MQLANWINGTWNIYVSLGTRVQQLINLSLLNYLIGMSRQLISTHINEYLNSWNAICCTHLSPHLNSFRLNELYVVMTKGPHASLIFLAFVYSTATATDQEKRAKMHIVDLAQKHSSIKKHFGYIFPKRPPLVSSYTRNFSISQVLSVHVLRSQITKSKPSLKQCPWIVKWAATFRTR